MTTPETRPCQVCLQHYPLKGFMYLHKFPKWSTNITCRGCAKGVAAKKHEWNVEHQLQYQCTQCNEYKLYSEYTCTPGTNSGLLGICKHCNNGNNRKKYHEEKAIVKAVIALVKTPPKLELPLPTEVPPKKSRLRVVTWVFDPPGSLGITNVQAEESEHSPLRSVL